MISWRYHVVSIVAVILAVALGVLAGATVVGDRFVKQLQQNTTDAERLAGQYRTEAERLRAVLNEAVPIITSNQLSGRQVVLVTQDPVDEAVRTEVVRSLQGAGAEVVAQLTATSAIADPSAGSEIEALLTRPPADPSQLPGALAAAVADRMEVGPPVRPEAVDILSEAGRFVRVEPRGVDVAAIGGPGTLVVAFAGGTSPPALDPTAFLLPFVEDLVKTSRDMPVAAGEGLTSDWGFVKALRDADGRIPDGSIVTVDDLDQTYGGIALVLGLHDLMTTPAGGGDYGVNGSAFLPPVPGPSG
ncbi:MAG: copper transporter [Actinobacteria bacterium]|nr:copper transporter [Actinomycetota bacterium]